MTLEPIPTTTWLLLLYTLLDYIPPLLHWLKNCKNLKQINLELLRYDLEQSDVVQVVSLCQNLNDSIVVYNDILSKILEKHAPLVQKYKTSKTPWWNLECQNARRRRRVFEFLKVLLERIKLYKINLNFMQHVNRLIKSIVLKEKNISKKN